MALLVVTYNSSAVLTGCLDAARVALARVSSRLVVVDNGSVDGTVELAQARRDCEVALVGSNRGYAGAINAGVEFVRSSGGAEAFVVCNPDTRLHEGSVEPLLARLAAPRVGIAVPRLQDEHGQLQYSLRRQPSLATTWCDAVFGGPLAHRLGLPTEVLRDDSLYRTEAVADWATGGLWAMSDSCLRSVGHWDESYFLYEEEVDFALRAKDHGYLLGFAPRSVATRLVGDAALLPWVNALMKINRVTHLRRRRGRTYAELVRAGLALDCLLRAAFGRREAWPALWALSRHATPSSVVARFR